MTERKVGDRVDTGGNRGYGGRMQGMGLIRKTRSEYWVMFDDGSSGWVTDAELDAVPAKRAAADAYFAESRGRHV
jgi:hypothetical protein